MAGTPSALRSDLTAAEAQFIALLREAITDAKQDGAKIIADAKAQAAPLYTALQTVLNGPTQPAPAVAPATPIKA